MARLSGVSRPARIRPAEVAAQIDADLRRLPVGDVPRTRAVRRAWTRKLLHETGRHVLETALVLRRRYGYRFVPYELVAAHPAAYSLLTEARLVSLGRGLDSWHAVDSFAR